MISFKIINITRLLNLFFICSLIFMVLFFMSDFFTVYYNLATKKFIFLDERRIFLEQNLLKIFGVFFTVLMLVIFSSIKIKINYFIKENKLIIFFIFIFVIYYLLMGSELRSMFFFGTLSTFFIYSILPFLFKNIQLENDFIKIKRIIIYISLTYLFLPLFVYLLHYFITQEKYFQYAFFPQLYIVDSFRGLSLDRIQYGFLSGIVLFFIFFMKKNIKYSMLIMFILLIGLYLSMSRAVIVALSFATSFYLFKQYNINFLKVFIYLLVFSIIIFIAVSFSDRVELFSDGGNRIGLLKMSLEKIFEKGYISFLFGSGSFYTISHGHQPHNIILQSIMNFGMLITMGYMIIIYNFFKNLNLKSKALFIYVFIFAQFHVGFSAFLFMPITLFSYVCIILFNIEERKENDNIIS
jgi:hypothetical protein